MEGDLAELTRSDSAPRRRVRGRELVPASLIVRADRERSSESGT